MSSTHAIPELAQFAQAMTVTLDLDRGESFWNAEASFLALTRSKAIVAAVNTELRALLEDDSYIGDWQSQQLVIQRGAGYALALVLFEIQRRYIHSMPYLSFVSNLSRLPVSYNIYELPASYRNDVFDPTIQLTCIGSGTLANTEVLAMRGSHYLYDLRIEHPTLLFQLSSSPYQTMEWLFNRETLFAWQANDSEVRSTQTRVAAYVLGRLAHPSSLEPLTGLLKHPHHSVRWAAIQAIGRLSRTAAIAALDQALDDPHPHVRRAADKVRKSLNATR